MSLAGFRIPGSYLLPDDSEFCTSVFLVHPFRTVHTICTIIGQQSLPVTYRDHAGLVYAFARQIADDGISPALTEFFVCYSIAIRIGVRRDFDNQAGVFEQQVTELEQFTD